MKRIEKCLTEDCIPTPSSCVKWNGGDIPFLGICEGDCLNIIVDEVISELQRIAGKDLSTFDINSLLEICEKEAPEEVTILSILTLLRDNHICLKELLDEIDAQLNELLKNQNVKVNLKCYTGFNGLGLSITRDQFDQFIIDILCNHEGKLDSADSTINRLRSEINQKALERRIEEVQVSTCINPVELPLSTQVQNTSTELCNLTIVVGTVDDINTALANTPADLNAEFGSIIGWNLIPANLSENFGNSILEVENLRQRILDIENVCCVVGCDKIKIGFSAVFNEDNTGIILRFNRSSGTSIPNGYEDCGSEGTITDKFGNTQDFDIAISAGAAIEIPLEGISTTGNLDITISAKICNNDTGTQCVKCVTGIVVQPDCQYCILTATENVTVLYRICSDII